MLNPIDAYRGLRAVGRIVMDPTNLDEVFVLADLSERSSQLEQVIAELREDPEIARLFDAKPRLGPVDQDALAELPEGTLGREYAEFMRARGLRHEDLTLVDSDDRDIDWLRNHLRETHDLWHVVTGFHTDVAGELGLQAFYAAQIEGPLPILLLAVGFTNTLVKGMDDMSARLDAITRGWLLGKRSRSMFGLRFADWLERPLSELREELEMRPDEVDAIVDTEGPQTLLAAA